MSACCEVMTGIDCRGGLTDVSDENKRSARERREEGETIGHFHNVWALVGYEKREARMSIWVMSASSSDLAELKRMTRSSKASFKVRRLHTEDKGILPSMRRIMTNMPGR